MSRAAMQQALDAYEQFREHDDIDALDDAMLAMRAALAEPPQEPVAWDVYEHRIYGAPGAKRHRVLWVEHYQTEAGTSPDLELLLRAAENGGIGKEAETLYVRPLYATPPQREPLTDEQIAALVVIDTPSVSPRTFAEAAQDYQRAVARAVERAHGIGGCDA